MNHFLVILRIERCFQGTNVPVQMSARKGLHDIDQTNKNLKLDVLFKTIYTAAAIFQFQYNLMRKARWLRSGAAVNIRLPGTGFSRGPLQLHSIQECRAWTVTWSWGQNFAHITQQKRFTNSRKKFWKFIFHEKLLLQALNLGHSATNLYSIQTEHFCKQLSVNPRTVSYSEIERQTERKKEREKERT